MNGFFQTWQEIYDWFTDAMQWVLEQFLLAFVIVLEAIPVPSWATNITSLPIPDGVAWFAAVFELPFGAAVMTSAWTIGFVIRRLPFIG